MNLHKKTQAEVQSLLNDTGHQLQLSDIPDIIELNELAEQVTSNAGAYSDIHSWPVKCGKLLLKPLTLGKMAWYNNCALKWFSDDIESSGTVLAFLLSLDNDERFVWSLTNPQDAILAINEWEKTVDATPAELAAAIDFVLQSSKKTDQNTESAKDDHGPLIAMLCREYGNTPNYWLYQASINVIRALTDEHVRKINQEIASHNKSAPKGGKNRVVVNPIKTPAMDATLKFRKKLLDLKEKWTASNGG